MLTEAQTKQLLDALDVFAADYVLLREAACPPELRLAAEHIHLLAAAFTPATRPVTEEKATRSR